MRLIHHAQHPDNSKTVTTGFTDYFHGLLERVDCLLVQGSCMDLLQLLPPESIGLTVTDPPYESLERHRAKGTTTRLKVSKASSNAWYATFPNTDYGELFKRLHVAQAKNSHCYVFCDSETEHVLLSGQVPYSGKPTQALQQDSVLGTHVVRARYATPLDVGWIAWPTLTWIKTRRTVKKSDREYLADLVERISCTPKVLEDLGEILWERVGELGEWLLRKGMGYHWSKCTERILFLEKGRKQLNDQRWPDVFFGPRAAKGEHPSKKPDNIVSRLIRNSSALGDWVFDPFAGSGVVGMQALMLGRKAILSDVDMQYINQLTLPAAARVERLELRP